LIEYYFVVGFWVDQIYSRSWGEFWIRFKEDYCYVYFETTGSYDYNYFCWALWFGSLSSRQ